MLQVPFTVSADLALGERVLPYLKNGGADVIIAEGEVPHSINDDDGGVAYQLEPGKLLLRVPNGVRILVEDGQRITYHRGEYGDDKEVALFLLGSAWGGLCYQRGLIPLHTSAVELDGELHAFTGHSGAGKSTLAAAVSAKGLNFFTDDVLIFDPSISGKSAHCYTGQKDLKLWGDAVEMVGAEATGKVRTLGDMDKHFARALSQSSANNGILRNLYVLTRTTSQTDPTNTVTPITGPAAMQKIMRSIYRPRYAQTLLGKRTYLEGIKALCETVSVYEFQREFLESNFDDSATFISQKITGSVG